MSPLILSLIVCSFIAWAYGLLMVLQVKESLRFAHNRQGDRFDQSLPMGRVALFVPCKGHDLELAENLRALFGQQAIHYELVFIVESREDSAFQVIRSLQREYARIESRIVIAGHSSESGQKVHNLCVATQDLPRDIDVLAFVDSDARPRADWLRSLVDRLFRDRVGAQTGYRWMVPQRNSLGNLLLYSVNASVASLFGPGGHYLLWGGSWAVQRDVFERTGISDAWRGTLSDDLVATRALRHARLDIRFEPRCMTPSPIDVTMAEATEFMRRQYLIGRRYAGRMWALALAANLVSQTTLWAGGAWGAYQYLQGNPNGLWALVSSVGLYLAGVARGLMRQRMLRHYLPHEYSQLSLARWFDTLCGPLAGLFNLAMMLSSSIGSQITWRGIRYWISPGGRVQLIGRHQPVAGRPEGQQAATILRRAA